MNLLVCWFVTAHPSQLDRLLPWTTCFPGPVSGCPWVYTVFTPCYLACINAASVFFFIVVVFQSTYFQSIHFDRKSQTGGIKLSRDIPRDCGLFRPFSTAKEAEAAEDKKTKKTKKKRRTKGAGFAHLLLLLHFVLLIKNISLRSWVSLREPSNTTIFAPACCSRAAVDEGTL